MEHSINKLCISFKSISVYRSILDNVVIKVLHSLINYISNENYNFYTAIDYYNQFYFNLANENENQNLKEFLISCILYDENTFSKISEKETIKSINIGLLNAIKNDLKNLQIIAEITPAMVKQHLLNSMPETIFDTEAVVNLPEWYSTLLNKSCVKNEAHDKAILAFMSQTCWETNIELLWEYYNRNGIGPFSIYKAFIWKRINNRNQLIGVMNPDPVMLSNLIGYENERNEVINNTLKFLKGYPANNMLLYGDRGTGKSTTVKAILNKYYKEGLRLIEVPKDNLIDFPEIIGYLKDRNQKFIIFVDDLSFEDNENSYNSLKAVLEGGVECKPDNVIIYATSNRRHLIKEKFSDRAGLSSSDRDDEVRSADTIQEKLSLSDRFGMTVVFSAPGKDKYIEIVEGILKNRGLMYDHESLTREALKWELWYNGRSPRTARQFADWFEGEIKKKLNI